MTGVDDDPAGGAVLGRVLFVEGGRPAEAVLGADGLWACDQAPAVAAMLNLEHSPEGQGTGPAWGRMALVSAARRLGGLACYGPGRAGPPPWPPGPGRA